MACSLSEPQPTLKPAWVGAWAPLAWRKVETPSASGMTEMKPSPTRQARSSALGPNAET